MAIWKRYKILSCLIVRESIRVNASWASSACIHTITLDNPSCRKCGSSDISTRSFFSLPGIGSKKKEYSGRKLVGYSMDQMYEVVSDVEHYRDFVPFCKRSLVTIRRPGYLKADLVIGFPPVNESYTSSVTMARPHLVKAVCTEGKLFNHLLTLWRFSPGLKENKLTCIVDFSVSFEFRSVLHSQLAHVFFNELVRQMENAFVEEAKKRYGKASVKTQRLRGIIQAGS